MANTQLGDFIGNIPHPLKPGSRAEFILTLINELIKKNRAITALAAVATAHEEWKKQIVLVEASAIGDPQKTDYMTATELKRKGFIGLYRKQGQGTDGHS